MSDLRAATKRGISRVYRFRDLVNRERRALRTRVQCGTERQGASRRCRQ